MIHEYSPQNLTSKIFLIKRKLLDKNEKLFTFFFILTVFVRLSEQLYLRAETQTISIFISNRSYMNAGINIFPLITNEEPINVY